MAERGEDYGGCAVCCCPLAIPEVAVAAVPQLQFATFYCSCNFKLSTAHCAHVVAHHHYIGYTRHQDNFSLLLQLCNIIYDLTTRGG